MGAHKQMFIEEQEEVEEDKQTIISLVEVTYGTNWKKALKSLQSMKEDNIVFQRFNYLDRSDIIAYVKCQVDGGSCSACKQREVVKEQHYEYGDGSWEEHELYPGIVTCTQCRSCYEPQYTDALAELAAYYKSRCVSARYFYCYVLLDASVWEEKPENVDKYETFLQSIFYVGKGEGKRYLEHFSEAVNNKISDKCDKIRQIWKENGVCVVQFRLQSQSKEALSYEECARLYLVNKQVKLTNKIPSKCYGVAGFWDDQCRVKCGEKVMREAFDYFQIISTTIKYTQDNVTELSTK